MNRFVLFLIFSLSSIALVSAPLAYAPGAPTGNPIPPSAGGPATSGYDVVPGQVVVGLDTPDPQFDDKVRGNGGAVIDSIDALNAFLVSVPNNAEDAFINAIQKNPNVKYAHRNFVVNAVFTPNDTYWNDQWNMRIVKADSAWDKQIGSTSIVVAVVDTGVKYNHPDLTGRVINGYDFINDDNDAIDDNGHGTHVSGTVGAITNNGKGVAGLAQVSLLAVKVLGSDGSGTDWSVAEGIKYAADNGAHIINLSLGCYCTSTLMEDATNYAYSNGKLLVAAAGNDNTNAKHYPAAYDTVIAVSATDKDDNKASYSNFGDWIELSAPGGDTKGGAYWTTYVLSTWYQDNYAYSVGTSMASPHVAGVAALALSEYPTLNNIDLRAHLRNTVDDLGDSGKDQFYGYGRVNALKAVDTMPTSTDSHDVAVTAVNSPSSVVKGSTVTVDVTVENQGTFDETFDVTLHDTTDNVSIGTETVTLVAGASTTVSFSWDTSSSTTGDHALQANASTVPEETDTADNTKSAIVTVSDPVHDVAVTAINAPSSASVDSIVTVDVTVENQGTFDETFDVTLHDTTDNVSIGTETVTLVAGGSTTISFSWDTTGESEGDHTIEATAGPVIDESDTTDNSMSTVVNISATSTNAVSVDSITYYTEGGPNKDFHLRVVVSVVDDQGNPVSGASVSIDLYLDSAPYASGTGTTGTDGKITFKVNNAPSGCYNTTVTDVTAEGLTWDNNTPSNGFCK